jgi:hypothetical protein
MKRVRSKEWLAFGLLLIIVGLALLYCADISVYNDNYVSKAILDNDVYYNENLPPLLSVTAYFEAGQHFFFNFTKGRFWGNEYDQEYGLDSPNPNFAPNTYLEAYKLVEFDLNTPSGDVVVAYVYMVGGSEAFAVVYANKSADFVQLLGGNLTYGNVGMEGIVESTGNYTVKAVVIAPPVMRDSTQSYGINTDPPVEMYLWNIESVETKPYLVSCASASGVLLFVGVVFSVWAIRPKNGRRAHLKKL